MSSSVVTVAGFGFGYIYAAANSLHDIHAADMPTELSSELMDFLKTEADTYLCEESAISPKGQMNYEEWKFVWKNAQEKFSDIPTGQDGEALRDTVRFVLSFQ